MVKGQVGQSVNRKPGGFSSVIATTHRRRFTQKNAHVDHRYGVPARVAAQLSEGAELAPRHALQSGFFSDFARHCIIKIFTVLDKATGQGVTPFKWWPTPLDQ